MKLIPPKRVPKYAVVIRNISVLALATIVTRVACADTIIYDNTTTSLGTSITSQVEFGDEIEFAPDTPRTLTTFQFSYEARIAPEPGKDGIVRIYANDGPPDPRNPDRHSPSSVLFESAPFPLADGVNTVTLNCLAISLPN